jgi:hypothetical protein
MSLIRKLSVGPNFPNDAVHFQVDSPILYDKKQKRKIFKVHSIEQEEYYGEPVYRVYIEYIPNKGESAYIKGWKRVHLSMPHVVEDRLDY